MTRPANAAASASIRHAAVKHAAQITRALTRPHGNYPHAEVVFATVAAVHGFALDGKPASVDVYPNGAQNLGTQQALVKGAGYLASYVPTVGDAVAAVQGYGRVRSSLLVLGKATGAASPYPVPLGGFDSVGRFATGLLSLWGTVSGTPNAKLGADGDWCMTGDGHLWWKNAGSWVQKV